MFIKYQALAEALSVNKAALMPEKLQRELVRQLHLDQTRQRILLYGYSYRSIVLFEIVFRDDFR